MSRLTDLQVEFVSLVDRAAVRDPSNPTEPQKFLLFKRESGAPPTTGGPMPDTATPEELSAALKKAEEERDALTAKVAKLEKKLAKKGVKTDDADADELNKADLPPAVRAAIEKSERDAAAAAERAKKAEQIAKAEQDRRLTAEFVTKAETLKHLPLDPEAFGPVLKRASELLEKDDVEAIDTLLKAANEQARVSELLKSYGRDGEPEGDREATDQLEKKAAEIRKDEGVSRAEAMRRAMRENPELTAGYLASQQ